jgi:hypothetical protein
MNPSAKAAGLSFQLSRTTIPGADDDRPHDNGPVARCTDFRPYPDCEYFTRQQLTCRNLASIRLSRYIAVCSGLAQSAFTRALVVHDHGDFPMAYLVYGSDSSSPLKWEASSEQKR